jgi:hypothetical protein
MILIMKNQMISYLINYIDKSRYYDKEFLHRYGLVYKMSIRKIKRIILKK